MEKKSLFKLLKILHSKEYKTQRLHDNGIDPGWSLFAICPQIDACLRPLTNPLSEDLFLWPCFECQMSWMLSYWEAGQPTSALRAAVQYHRARTQGRQEGTAKRPFPYRIFLSNLAELRARESNSTTRPVPGILSRWWWTGAWTERLGREWWLVPEYTSGNWVPFSSSCHMPGMATDAECPPLSLCFSKVFICKMTCIKFNATETLTEAI